jgi:hypothetical protein
MVADGSTGDKTPGASWIANQQLSIGLDQSGAKALEGEVAVA